MALRARAGTVFHGTVGQPSAQVIDGSLKFDSSSSQYLRRTPTTAGNRKTFTYSCWLKRFKFGSEERFLETAADGNNQAGIKIQTNSQIQFFDYTSSAYVFNLQTTQVFRDTGWYHIVFAVDTTQSTSSDRVKIYVNGTQVTDFSTETYPSNTDTRFNNTNAHEIGDSVFDQHLNAEMSQVYLIDGQALTPDSFGFTDPLTNTWRPKKYTDDFNIAAESYSTAIGVFTKNNTTPNADDTVAYLNSNPDSSSYPLIQSSQVANNEIIVKFVSAQNGVTSIKFRGGGYASGSTYTLFVNGTQVGGTHSTNTLWAEDSHTISSTNITELKIVGSDGFALGQLKFNDSLVSGTSSFGTEATGVNSFYLPMDGNSPIGQDKSGNGNNWTPVSFNGTSIDPDVLKDSPSGAVYGGPPTSGITTTNSPPANYCTLNPLDKESGVTLSNGNLDGAASGSDGNYRGTISMKTGKFYWEITQVSGGNYSTYGIIRSTLPVSTLNDDTITYRNDGLTKKDGVDGSTYNSISGSDVLGVACDCDNNQISYYKNNTLQGTLTFTTEMTDDGVSAYGRWNDGKSADYNFGQKPFKFPPPDGFQPLNTANVRPETVIARPDKFVGATIYTGNGGTKSISVGHKPDFVWIKERNGDISHQLYDAVRGVTKKLSSNTTDEETTTSGGLTSFNFNGFTLGDYGSVNTSSDTYVAWTWKAGGNKGVFNVDDVGYASAAAAGLSASGNSWDSDPTGASIGARQGFSIIKHTGTGSAGTLPHGLTQKPTFYISKPVSTTGNWVVYTDVIDGSLDYLYLNTGDSSGNSGQSLPTSELFSYGYTANEYIHYLWHDVPGLQKFGSYTGKSALNFVELGFRPALIMLKNSSNSSYTSYTYFAMFDSTRDTHNTMQNVIFAGKSQEENKRGNGGSMSSVADFSLDFLSNGFALRDNGASEINLSGSTYIYAAWAEAPTVNLFGGQSNAR